MLRGMDKEPLSVKEAAAKLRCHPETLRRALREGSVDGQKIRGLGDRGQWRVPAREVERLRGEGEE